MKRLILFSAIIPLLFSSCVKEPYADFIASKSRLEPGEVVYFTNRSYDAQSYEWDFGDGYSSINFNSSHFYESPGRYTVILSAFGKDGRLDRKFTDIEVVNTVGSLQLIVVERNLNYTIIGARVRLYLTKTDWDNETNLFAEEFTNSQGSIIFDDLPANRVYYIDVYEAKHNNYNLPNQLITSPVVQAGKLVTFEAKAELSVGSLEITVLEWEQKYPIYEASVRLYPTVEDWENETNMLIEGFTNTQGRVIFNDLDANRLYYVDVWEADHDNYTLAAEDVGFIETLVVLPGKMNYWTAYVDYYPPGKKSGLDRKALKKHLREVHKPALPRVPLKNE